MHLKSNEIFETLSLSFVAQCHNLPDADFTSLARFSTGCRATLDSLRHDIENALGPARVALEPYLTKQIPWDVTVLEAFAEEHGQKIVAVLIGALQRRDMIVQSSAIRMLRSLRAYEAAAALGRVIKSGSDTAIRAQAADLLGELGGTNADAFACLAETSRGDNSSLRSVATRALGKIDAPPEDLLPLLLERLNEDEDWDVRRSAAVSLGRLGPDAEKALPYLYRFQRKCPSPSAGRDAATEAIHNISLGERRHRGHPEK